MCRILGVAAREPFAIAPQLAAFAHICEHSSEYQGHGWGYSYWAEHGWVHYHDIRPIWEDPTAHDATSPLLIAHARSAFRDEGIAVENNMPFADERNVFVFNGELRGVRIKANGRIGAEKIFNYVKRFNQGDMGAALAKGTDIIEKRSRYVRAMNIIMADANGIYVSSSFGENPEYFQMQVAQSEDRLTICSSPLRQGDAHAEQGWADTDWTPFPNHHMQSFQRW
jgi:predicted glutamine amidotransferase